MVKRAFDICFVLIAALPGALIGSLAALAIRAGDGGPVLYRSRRVGHRGVPFGMLKFRTMQVDGDRRLSDAQRRRLASDFKLENDPRVTAVGRVLRRTSLDELPQLVNVLRGEMSVVGPRPKLLEEIDGWGGAAARLTQVRPGLTGLWQVERTTAASDDVMRRLDLQYAASHTLAMDLSILLRTPRAMLRKVDD